MVAKDRTVTLNGRLYEAPVSLIGQRVELFFHPEDMNHVEVRFQQQSYGLINPVNLAINCLVKRDKNSQLDITTPCPTGQLFSRTSGGDA